jgi:hypothetical protein
MAKLQMVCPISKGMCVECGVYRGRHYYLCYAHKFCGQGLEAEKADQHLKNKCVEDETFGMPDFVELGSRCIKNVEDIVERREI